jgi:hemerythrin-like domain-containing protein
LKNLEIKGHAAAEEQALWSTVLRKPEITEDGRHAVAEHHEMDELLNDLAATDMATGGWLTKFRTVKEEYLHHIKEEEGELFPNVEKHLNDADQKYMASVFKRRKQSEKAKAEVTPEKKTD